MYALDMLIAAVAELDFFTWMNSGPRTADEIARHFALHHRPVDVMTTLFVAQGLLARDGAALVLTDTAREHLVASSPWFLGPYYPKLADRPIARDLIGVLRTDRPAHFAGRDDQADWHRAMETDTFAEEFTAAMIAGAGCSDRRWRRTSICGITGGCSTSPAARGFTRARSPPGSRT